MTHLLLLLLPLLALSTSSPILTSNHDGAEPPALLLFDDDRALPHEGGTFEGDMILTREQQELLITRSAIRGNQYRWPDPGNIPYTIDTSSFNESQLSVIESAMQRFVDETCIKFVPKDGNDWKDWGKNYIKIIKRTGCYSYVGMQQNYGEGQDLSLGEGCVEKGVVMHELIHAVGFVHEQSRS